MARRDFAAAVTAAAAIDWAPLALVADWVGQILPERTPAELVAQLPPEKSDTAPSESKPPEGT